MLTGSFALSYYGRPRMTRDLDFVVALHSGDAKVLMRRKSINLGGVATWIVSREDLILSKLVWSLDSRSELQLRDVQSLLDESIDWSYLKHWASLLDVATLLEEARK